MTHHTDAERAAFEAWARGYGTWEVKRDDDVALGTTGYTDITLTVAWHAVQAARRAPAAPVPQQDVEKLRAELAEEVEAADDWRRLALQFDGHRMQAIGHLKAMLTDPQGSEANALAFIKAPPLHGDAVLAQRIAAIAAALQPPEAAPVQLPEPLGVVVTTIGNYASVNAAPFVRKGDKLYTEKQVRELLANHGIQERST